MQKIRLAVIGVGYLGQYHAQKLASLPDCQLVAVCDLDLERAREIAEPLHAIAITTFEDLVGTIDAVIIATPTPSHFAIGQFFLEHGIHVLMEKPITTTLAEADALIALTKKNGLVLQVGHLERFNNAVKALTPLLNQPRFIQCSRLSSFQLRGTDVNVILDLMIHDIDLVLSLLNTRPTRVCANGASVLSSSIDIANARLEFANGCVADFTASRISLKKERKLRVFQHDSHIGLDLQHKNLQIYRKGFKEMLPGIPEIVREKFSYEQGDALRDQDAAFIQCILTKTAPIVGGLEGKQALETAIQITEAVHNTNQLLNNAVLV